MYGPGFVVVASLFTILFLILFLGGLYETWAFATGHPPITEYLRPAVNHYPAVAFLVALFLGWVVGHLSKP